MNTGKALRLDRIFNRNTGRTIIVPMDHGVTVGPIKGLEDIRPSSPRLVDGGANAGLVHKGLRGLRPPLRRQGLRPHRPSLGQHHPLSLPQPQGPGHLVEEALRLGADGVSVHVNIGDENESVMLEHLGVTAEKADYWGMPLLAMVYARGPKIKNEYAPEVVAHCARVGMELGAGRGQGQLYRRPRLLPARHGKLLRARGHCRRRKDGFHPRPVGDGQRLAARGRSRLSVGRNVFQHEDPTRLVRALNAVVHESASVDEALSILDK